MALAALKEQLVEMPSFPVSEQLNAEVGRAVVRMIAYCKKNKALAEALAEGPVFDSTTSIVDQINTIFPAHLRTDPVVDDLITFITETAEKARQNNQRLRFTFFTQGKKPEGDDKEGAQFVRVYTDRGSKSSDNYDHIKMALKMNGGGSSGGSGQQMVEELTAGLDSGFVLNVSTAVSQDTLGVNMDQMQSLGAFAQSTEAMAEVKEMMANGDTPPAVQNVIQQIADIKTLQNALKAAEGPQVTAIAAALAIKTEGLNAALPNTNLPPAIAKEVGRQIESVKNDFSATQLARVVDLISTSLPANQTDKPAAHAQIKEIIEQVRATAKAENMTVKEMLAVVLSGAKDVAPIITKAVTELTKTLAKPEAIQILDRALPAAIAQIVRRDIATPAMTQAAQTPIKIDAISRAIETVADKTGIQGLKAAIEKLDAIPAKQTTFANTLSIPVVTSIAENAHAMTMVKTLPPSMPASAAQSFKADMTVIKTIAESKVVQLREPSHPIPVPTQILPTAPIVKLAEIVQVPPPQVLPYQPPIKLDPVLHQPTPPRETPPIVVPTGGTGPGPINFAPPATLPTPVPSNPQQPPIQQIFKDVVTPPAPTPANDPQPKPTPILEKLPEPKQPEPPRQDGGPRDINLIQPKIEPVGTGPTYKAPLIDPGVKPELPKEALQPKPETKDPVITSVVVGGPQDPYKPPTVDEKTGGPDKNPNPCQPPNCPCGKNGCLTVNNKEMEQRSEKFDVSAYMKVATEVSRPRVVAVNPQ
ncbi:MAG TPA: hypothetical protein VIN59_05775 [Alphaproteobacteria bacterium]